MKNENSNSNNRRGFAAMDPNKRREAAKKGGHASRLKENLNQDCVSETTIARGFAAMDVEKRKQIARRGGSVSRRNRTGNQDQIFIL